MSTTGTKSRRRDLVKPAWLKVRAPGSPDYLATRELVKRQKLHTVCEEAHCPNIGECWSHRTATFMILGDLCTRRCHFCAVKKGTAETLVAPDPLEPERVGESIADLGLQHAVITSVDRDDLPDFGAGHFARTVAAIRRHAPDCKIELLIPDLQGSSQDLATILDTGVDILNHNVETVPRLYRKVRPGSGYIRSLMILKWSKEHDPNVRTKSGIMVGLGEEESEVFALMDDLRAVGVDIMTIGQYLRPSQKQLPIREYVSPEQFETYRIVGLDKGFTHVESGPLVRSSYHAWKHSA